MLAGLIIFALGKFLIAFDQNVSNTLRTGICSPSLRTSVLWKMTEEFRLRLSTISLSATGLALIPSLASAAQIQFQEGVSPVATYNSQITYVRNDDAGNASSNKNADNQLILGKVTTPGILRSLFSFDVSSLPDGAVITDVTFRLTDNGRGSTTNTSGAVAIELNKLASSFDETTVTYNTQPAFSTLLSSALADPSTINTGDFLTFPSSSAFVQAVQEAADADGSVSFVAKLNSTSEGQNLRRAYFFRTDQDASVADRPLLTITYVPEPTSIAFAGMASVGVGLLRRRKMIARV